MTPIPFNRPALVGRELEYLQAATLQQKLSGDGPFTKRCTDLLQRVTGARGVLLTHSCTAALEMAAMLLDIQSGDEVIMPSYTFVSTANAFALRGATPVFIDIRADTLNLDESLIEGAVTPRTKAIVPVHYAGVACEMTTINAIAQKHGLAVVEDAAQGIFAEYQGQRLGALGQLGALSFHDTKNVIAGEGGALLVNDASLMARAEIIREKGTNRSRFFRGEVDKYTWVDIGSSFLPSELTAAFLLAQLEQGQEITAQRLSMWGRYHDAFAEFERQGLLVRPTIPDGCRHNGHLYYLLLRSSNERDELIAHMRRCEIHCVFHYVPLHASDFGRRRARVHGAMKITEDLSDRLVRLPLWLGMTAVQHRIIEQVVEFFRER